MFGQKESDFVHFIFLGWPPGGVVGGEHIPTLSPPLDGWSGWSDWVVRRCFGQWSLRTQLISVKIVHFLSNTYKRIPLKYSICFSKESWKITDFSFFFLNTYNEKIVASLIGLLVAASACAVVVMEKIKHFSQCLLINLMWALLLKCLSFCFTSVPWQWLSAEIYWCQPCNIKGLLLYTGPFFLLFETFMALEYSEHLC